MWCAGLVAPGLGDRLDMANSDSDTQSQVQLEDGRVVSDRWRVAAKLGEGGFGAVYRVENTLTGRQFAMKVESTKEKESMIKLEVAILKMLQKREDGRRHWCQYLDSGRTGDMRYMVMELLGPNLSDLRRRQSGGRFTDSTTVRVGVQCLRGIEALHRIGFLHRDIKPANYAMGRGGRARVVHALDYGLGRQYVTGDGQLRPPRDSVGFRGTVRYASISAHNKRDLGRHDDLWSLLYVLIEFSRGALPWRKISDRNEVGKKKKQISPDELLQRMPPEFYCILNELERLRFDHTPKYAHFYQLLQNVMIRKQYREEDPFDWELTR